MATNSSDSLPQPGRDGVTTASRKGDLSRQRILDAALVEFGKSGFRSATTRAIAARANTTLPPLKYYFGSKEGLYRACAEEIVARYARATAPAVEGAQQTIGDAETARAALKELMRASVEFILGNEAYALGNGIIARELAEPGPAFDIFYDRLWLPGIERNARLISRIKSEPAISEESRLQAILIVSSIPSFQTRRLVAQRAMAWQDIGDAERQRLTDVLHQQIDRM
ncbi:MAG: CerR family C-terminal domain-containing protein [Sphingomonadales bacterium]|nr:CerR family C-terminal domain-containing protein [Sphingomonadales bacterium]